jgi:hypothetical protein
VDEHEAGERRAGGGDHQLQADGRSPQPLRARGREKVGRRG